MGGLAGPDARHQRLGIGLPRKFDELGPQVLLKGPPGQGGAGGEFVARLVGNVPDGDGHTHSIIMQLLLRLCNHGSSHAAPYRQNPEGTARIIICSTLRGAGARRAASAQGSFNTSARTPVSWSKPALASVVSRIRLVLAAVAAIIMSFADLGRPFAIAATARRACTRAMPTLYGSTGRLDKIASTRTARAWRCAVSARSTPTRSSIAVIAAMAASSRPRTVSTSSLPRSIAMRTPVSRITRLAIRVPHR